LSVRRQCELLGLSRSSLYYEPAAETAENLRLMRLLDGEYTAHPFLGSRRLTKWLIAQGEAVNRKRVQRLMRIMGLEAIYPKPKLSAAGRGHRIYPYLLRGVSVQRPDQVWSTDITYVPLASGFMYLAAVIDWFSRYVVAWRLSNTLDGSFCLEMLDEALRRGRPEVFNTDQGVQFTAQAWTGRLESAGVAVSMDGRGRCLDNVFVERLWRTVKYQDIYLWRSEAVPQLQQGLGRYFPYYYRASYCPPRYVPKKSKPCCPGSGTAGAALRLRVRSTTRRAVSVSRACRVKTHGPSSSGCSPRIAPRSTASRRVRVLTPRDRAASVSVIRPSARRRSGS
jgi:putative transposase